MRSPTVLAGHELHPHSPSAHLPPGPPPAQAHAVFGHSPAQASSPTQSPAGFRARADSTIEPPVGPALVHSLSAPPVSQPNSKRATMPVSSLQPLLSVAAARSPPAGAPLPLSPLSPSELKALFAQPRVSVDQSPSTPTVSPAAHAASTHSHDSTASPRTPLNSVESVPVQREARAATDHSDEAADHVPRELPKLPVTQPRAQSSSRPASRRGSAAGQPSPTQTTHAHTEPHAQTLAPPPIPSARRPSLSDFGSLAAVAASTLPSSPSATPADHPQPRSRAGSVSAPATSASVAAPAHASQQHQHQHDHQRGHEHEAVKSRPHSRRPSQSHSPSQAPEVPARPSPVAVHEALSTSSHQAHATHLRMDSNDAQQLAAKIEAARAHIDQQQEQHTHENQDTVASHKSPVTSPPLSRKSSATATAPVSSPPLLVRAASHSKLPPPPPPAGTVPLKPIGSATPKNVAKPASKPATPLHSRGPSQHAIHSEEHKSAASTEPRAHAEKPSSERPASRPPSKPASPVHSRRSSAHAAPAQPALAWQPADHKVIEEQEADTSAAKHKESSATHQPEHSTLHVPASHSRLSTHAHVDDAVQHASAVASDHSTVLASVSTATHHEVKTSAQPRGPSPISPLHPVATTPTAAPESVAAPTEKAANVKGSASESSYHNQGSGGAEAKQGSAAPKHGATGAAPSKLSKPSQVATRPASVAQTPRPKTAAKAVSGASRPTSAMGKRPSPAAKTNSDDKSASHGPKSPKASAAVGASKKQTLPDRKEQQGKESGKAEKPKKLVKEVKSKVAESISAKKGQDSATPTTAVADEPPASGRKAAPTPKQPQGAASRAKPKTAAKRESKADASSAGASKRSPAKEKPGAGQAPKASDKSELPKSPATAAPSSGQNGGKPARPKTGAKPKPAKPAKTETQDAVAVNGTEGKRTAWHAPGDDDAKSASPSGAAKPSPATTRPKTASKPTASKPKKVDVSDGADSESHPETKGAKKGNPKKPKPGVNPKRSA